MEISKATLATVENIIKSAKLVDVSEIQISSNELRGINSSKTAFMLSNPELPDDFETICINRPDVFTSRFNLIKDSEYKVTAKSREASDGETFIEQLDFKSKSIKAQFRCCAPSAVVAPKSVNDGETYFVKFSEDDVKTIVKANSSIDSVNLKIIGDSEAGVNYVLTDMGGDEIVIQSDESVTSDEPTPFNFDFDFASKPFLNLIKNSESYEFTLGKRGVLKIQVNSIDFYLLPQVQ